MIGLVAIFSNIKYLSILLGVVALGALAWYFHHLTSEIAQLRANVAQEQVNTQVAQTAAQQNAQAVQQVRVQAAKDIATIQKQASDEAQLQDIHTQILTEIQNAPASDDGPVAPVLKRTLDCLRNAARESYGSTNPVCQDTHSGATAAPAPASHHP